MDPSENPNHASLLKRLGLTNQQLSAAAAFTNSKYPNLDLDFKLEDPENIAANSPAYLQITISRDLDDDDDNEDAATATEPDTTVHAPFYPQRKTENWWLVIGDQAAGTLLAIKRVTVGRKLALRLEFVLPTQGVHELRLYLMSDSYVGVDQDPAFRVVAKEGEEDEEDEEDEDEEE